MVTDPSSPGGAPGPPIVTVGHGTLPAAELSALLRDAGVTDLVDVRSFPGSRRNPHFGREEMERWTPRAGVRYRWARDLGGRRRQVAGSKHVALRHASFRAYADHMETPAFLEAVDDLIERAQAGRTAVMCSESVWWRCHRRLLADHLVLVRGLPVLHLMHDGRLTRHTPTEGVRLDGDQVTYDVGVTAPLPVEP
ncbi:MAG TPA: DUF488 domain-containing protein [Iamia sp.]|nr:DUF488 domain-containing protein [Iamia sp.]